jgi:hypothetical protein
MALVLNLVNCSIDLTFKRHGSSIPLVIVFVAFQLAKMSKLLNLRKESFSHKDGKVAASQK